ncbi:flagellar brake protein [Natronospora cellulosivora (SeqCode)]
MIEGLEINQKIDIIVEAGPYKGKYLSKVSEIESDIFKVSPPYSRGEIVPLRKGQILRVYFTDETAAYIFAAKVLAREKQAVSLIKLERISDLKRIQRREYFRLDVKKTVKYRLIKNPFNKEDLENEQGEFQKGETLDISGGGLKLYVDDEFPNEGFIEFYIDIPGIEAVPIFGKIVNQYNVEDMRAVGIKYVDIAHSIQEKIISWLFDYQRQLRKRGLL